MLIFFRLTLMLMLLASAVRAQTTAPASAAAAVPAAEPLLPPAQAPGNYHAYLRQRYAADPPALAVVRLFERRQRGGKIWLAGGAAVVGGLLLANGTYRLDNNTTLTLQVGPLAYLILAGPPLGVGVGKLARFSNGRLYQALVEYERSGQWPNYVRRRVREVNRE